MSNYHVEPIDKPAGPDQGGDQVAAQAAGPGPVAAAAPARLARHRDRPVAARGHRRDARLRLAEPQGRLRRADQDRRPRRRQAPELDAADRRGLPGLLPGGARLHRPRRPGPAAVPGRRGHDRRRHRAQRPGALPALPAPRLQAEPVPQELLVRVPVPRLALRPARDQGRRRPVRAGAAEHGSLLDHRRRRRRPDARHRQDHARPAARSRVGQPGIIPPRTPTGCI